MQHRVAEDHPQAESAGPRGPSTRLKTRTMWAGTSGPPLSSPPAERTPPNFPDELDHAQDGRRRCLPGGQRGGAKNDEDFAALASALEDAVLVRLCVVSDDVILPGSSDAVIRPACQGPAVFYLKGNTAFIVWTAIMNERVSVFCSSGTESLNENVGAGVRTCASCKCLHAAAKSISLHGVAQHLHLPSVCAILRRHVALDNARANPDDVSVVPAFDSIDGRAAHVVAYNRLWCVLITKPERWQMPRPLCRHVPSRTRSSFCVHSCAVKPPLHGFSEFAFGSNEEDGLGDDVGSENRAPGNGGPSIQPPSQDGPSAAATKRPAAPAARKKGAVREFIDTDLPRSARILLPCAPETTACREWDERARGQTPADGMSLNLHERQ